MNNWVGDVKANPKDFYRYTNSQKKDSQGIPLRKREIEVSGVAQSESEKAAKFNGQFTCIVTYMLFTCLSLIYCFLSS